jgi:microcystin-dependent protein
MAEPFIGEIRMFSFNYYPSGWLPCNGQTLPISQNTALFSLLGTTYGGDGKTTFKLPDLRDRVVVNAGQGTDLSSYTRGSTGGVTEVKLTTSEIPSHTHPLVVVSNGGRTTTSSPAGASFVSLVSDTQKAYGGAGDPTGSAVALPSTGFGQPHTNEQPYLVLNFCICTSGNFPTRN